MPSIRRQQPTAKQKDPKKLGVLDRIQPVTLGTNGLSFSIYGKSGTGKTVLACTFPKPILLIGAEDGTKSVHDVDGVDFVPIYDSNETSILAATVINRAPSRTMPDQPYATVVLDTASTLQDMILKEILGLETIPVQKSWGMASRDQYGQTAIQVKERLRELLCLTSIGVNVLIIAQERNFNEETNSEGLAPHIGAGLMPSIVSWLNPACDYIVQSYIRQGMEEKVLKVGDKEVRKQVPKPGSVEFCIRTAPDPIFMTKFRVPKGSPKPPVIVDPDYNKIIKIIKGVTDARAVKKSK